MNLYYWAADYIYVGRKWVASVFDRSDSSEYRNPSAHPVILIPGIYENWHFMKPVIKILYKNGYDVHVIDGLGYNKGTIEEMSRIVRQYITDNNLGEVILVTHSKGGLIGKYLLSSHNITAKIRGLVALNAPFMGSRYAYILPFKSLSIFAPNSKILKLLTKDLPANKKIVSIYGRFDPHIPNGSRLEGAKNIKINTHGHFRTMSDSNVHKAILDSVAEMVR